MAQASNAATAATQHEGKLKKKMANLNAEKAKLSDRLRQEEPTNIASLEELRNDAQAELDSTIVQFASLNEQKEKANQDAQPLTEKKDRLTADLDQRRQLQLQIGERMNSAVTNAQGEQETLTKFESRLAAQTAQVEQFEVQLEGFQATRADRAEQASHVCERPEVHKKRTVESLEKEIKLIEKSLAERERQQGASLEQILRQLAERRAAANDAKAALGQIETLCKALSSAHAARVLTWLEFRTQISIRAKDQFLFHLTKRGFAGKINFHHEKTRLDMRVQTEDVASTKTKTKDTKSLSGGEKSFSKSPALPELFFLAFYFVLMIARCRHDLPPPDHVGRGGLPDPVPGRV